MPSGFGNMDSWEACLRGSPASEKEAGGPAKGGVAASFSTSRAVEAAAHVLSGNEKTVVGNYGGSKGVGTRASGERFLELGSFPLCGPKLGQVTNGLRASGPGEIRGLDLVGFGLFKGMRASRAKIWGVLGRDFYLELE